MKTLSLMENFLLIGEENNETTVKNAILFAVAVWASLIALSGTSAAMAWCADSTLHISNSLGFATQGFFSLWTCSMPVAALLLVCLIISKARTLNPPDLEWEIWK